MGYIGYDFDMNGNMFVCIECRNKGAYPDRTLDGRGVTVIKFVLPPKEMSSKAES